MAVSTFIVVPIAAALSILGISRTGSDLAITFEAEQGVTYQLERRTNLTTAPWQSIPGVSDFTATSNGPARIVDPGAANLSQAFYRIAASRGIFVDATGGADANGGTRSSPKRTLAAAIAAAAAGPIKDVYVSRGTYNETVTLASGVSLYGGYDPGAGWTRSSNNTTTIVSPGPIGIIGSGLSAPVTVEMFEVFAANASGNEPNGDGRSSYAVLILNSPGRVTFNPMSIRAGSGSPGLAGAMGSPGAAGSSGGDASGQNFGNGGASPCGAPGGRGGFGPNATVAGSPGTAGTTAQGGGTGASGGGGGTAGTCNATSSSNGGAAPALHTVGGMGGPGVAGAPGLALGSLNPSGLYLPPAGGNGGSGYPGGGGGGGGSGGGTAHGHNFFCTDCVPHWGGGGGGGGGGGCGGWGGQGGRGGGGSFAVAIVNSVVSIQSTKLTAGTGGNGGSGGDGGLGGIGGKGGMGAAGQAHNDCTLRSGGNGANGSPGGAGGQGGGGAGGAGGPSISILYKGTAPSVNGVAFATGSVGQGGAGGRGAFQAQPGPAGISGSIIAAN